MLTKLWWYGYVHINGKLFTKRWCGHGDLREANESDFVERTHGPFPADTKPEARAILMHHFWPDDNMFMPPDKKIVPPVQGWEESTVYIVNAAFSSTNPVHRYLFYSGFLHEGEPGNYNEFMCCEDCSFRQVYYLKALEIVARRDIHKGMYSV